MDEQKTTQEKAQELREKLRNERKSRGNQGNTSTGKSSRSTNAPFGPDSQDIGTDTGKASRDTTVVRSDNRSAQISIERSGQDNGRSFDNGSSFTDGSYQASSSIGGLERVDGPLPTKRPVGRPRKTEQAVETAANIKKAFFKKKTTLTEEEANKYKEPLMRVLQSYGEYYDRYIRWKTQQPDMKDIWGNITNFEAEAMSSIAIRRGMKSAHAAETIRSAINGEDYVSVALMFIPRIIATTEEMKKIPPKPNKRRKKLENIS